MRNKLLTSLKRREKETTEKERHSSGELPSFVAHSLVPSHTIPVCPSPDCQINTAPALSIDLDTIRSIRLSLKDKTHLTAMKTISISSWNRLSVVDLNWRFKLWLEISYKFNLAAYISISELIWGFTSKRAYRVNIFSLVTLPTELQSNQVSVRTPPEVYSGKLFPFDTLLTQ